MATQETGPSEPIVSKAQLVEYIASGCRPAEDFAFGLESELHGLDPKTGEALPYDDAIRPTLEAFCDSGYTPVMEGRYLIGGADGDSSVALEPGGQFEIASNPCKTVTEVVGEYESFLERLGNIDSSRAWLSLGFRPFGGIDDIPWMPKGRYKIMRGYMPKVGSRGHQMMKRTGTVQVNIDYHSEKDAHDKLKLSLWTSSIVNALYASSNIIDGKDTAFQSYRGYIWLDTDNQRCGLLPFVDQTSNLFEAYTDWALDVPMYFINRGGQFVEATHVTFRQFWEKGLAEHRATVADWQSHLSTLFPEARMKRFIEVRACDASSFDMNLALPALCAGLYYSPGALAAGLDLLRPYSFQERARWRAQVPLAGFATKTSDGQTLGGLARQLLAIASQGLSEFENGATSLLDPLLDVAESERTVADRVLDIWKKHDSVTARLDALRAMNCVVN